MNIDTIDRTVRYHRWVALLIVLLVLVVYLGRYLLGDSECRSPSAESWGQFGDYVGGLLNPLIAFLALFWLTESVLIQRRELNDTKLALADTAKSQSQQVIHAERTVRIGALGSMLDSLNADIASLRHAIEVVSDAATRTGWAISPDGERLQNDRVRTYLEEKTAALNTSLDQRNSLLGALRRTIDGEIQPLAAPDLLRQASAASAGG